MSSGLVFPKSLSIANEQEQKESQEVPTESNDSNDSQVLVKKVLYSYVVYYIFIRLEPVYSFPIESTVNLLFNNPSFLRFIRTYFIQIYG